MARILITGGTGFVGAHLMACLQTRSSSIAVLASGATPCRLPGVDYYEADIRDFDALKMIFREVKPEQVFHLAGISDVGSAWNNARQTYEVNFWGTLNVFEAALGLPNPPRVLNISTAQVYAAGFHPLSETDPVAPGNPYAASKAMAELLMVGTGKHSTGGIITVRAFNHSGPGQSEKFALPTIAKQFAEIEAGRRPRTLLLGNTAVRRDFTDVRDVVRAYCLLLERGTIGEIYNVCSGSAVALTDIISLFRLLVNGEVEIGTDASKLRSHEVDSICGNPEKTFRATGWRPQIPLANTIADLLDYWRSHIRAEVSRI
ncbi:MAG: GDP-mannose 4,6-dehydratase [Acidobacteria bacterium]|nr:GDP-mannose 4,6-dehydratase [Acidobacteriota bacterium]